MSWTGKCYQCGAPVRKPTPSRIAANRGRFCSKSCGISFNGTKHGHNARGMGATPTYRSWNHMQQRCDNPRNDKYADYGGRGITICDRWRDFGNFLTDMGERPAGTSLDRIDNERGYEPGNCRWATRSEQVANQRRSNRVRYQGEEVNLYHLGERIGINPMTLLHRIRRGWAEERWAETPKPGGRPRRELCREALD